MVLLWNRLGLQDDRVQAASFPHVAGVSLTSLFGDRMSSAEIRRLARRCVEAFILRRLDHEDMGNGGRPHQVFHTGPLDELRRRGQGAVVASIHLGPYCFVGTELLRRGFDVAGIADDEAIERARELWERAPPRLPPQLQLMRVGGARSLLHALRSLKSGTIALVYIDGGTSLRGPA